MIRPPLGPEDRDQLTYPPSPPGPPSYARPTLGAMPPSDLPDGPPSGSPDDLYGQMLFRSLTLDA